MAPNAKDEAISESFHEQEQILEKFVAPQWSPYKQKVLYSMLLPFIFIYLSGIYGIKYVFVAKWSTIVFMYIYYVAGIMGVTAGVHRLWSHNSFKANLPLQILLMLCHSASNQFSAIWWVQVHRQHHKYSDTDGDPMNAARGFFYSYIGWLFVTRHPECIKRRHLVDASDVRRNPVLMFQKKYIAWVILTMAVILPSTLPMLWGESFTTGYFLNMSRLFFTYNMLFTVNSVGHMWGNRPFDKSLRPAQTKLLHFFAFGDGYHNFHHAFPWDYRSAERDSQWSFTTAFIDFFAKIGWASDLKSVPQDVINTRVKRTGDGSMTVFC